MGVSVMLSAADASDRARGEGDETQKKLALRFSTRDVAGETWCPFDESVRVIYSVDVDATRRIRMRATPKFVARVRHGEGEHPCDGDEEMDLVVDVDRVQVAVPVPPKDDGPIGDETPRGRHWVALETVMHRDGKTLLPVIVPSGTMDSMDVAFDARTLQVSAVSLRDILSATKMRCREAERYLMARSASPIVVGDASVVE